MKHRRTRLMGVLLLCSGCVGVPRDPGASPQAWRAAEAAAEAPLPRLELVPVVPRAPGKPETTRLELPAPGATPRSGGAEPFWTAVQLVNGDRALVATTNNSLDSHVAPDNRGFPVCLRGDAVRYRVDWRADLGEAVTTAEATLAGNLGNCRAMNAPMHYLVLDALATPSTMSMEAVDGSAPPTITYRVVASSTGLAPATACPHPGLCPPLRVTLPALERALGGLKLAGQPLPAQARGAAAPLTVLSAAHRSRR